MCGRYMLTVYIEDLVKRYQIRETNITFLPQEEIFPSNMVPVISNEDEIKLMKWGFSPSFAKRLIINARSETIEKKPTFRKGFFQQRCLIPATGFFEWKKTKGKSSDKYLIANEDENIFSLAGIYDSFKGDDGQAINSFAIITRAANPTMESIHSRMPVIISKEKENEWLNPANKELSKLKELLNPSEDNLQIQKV